MFKELLPIIQERPLTITAVHIGDGRIRLCVVPHHQEKDSEVNKRVRYRKDVPKISDKALKALTTPLAIEGTPEELDAELAQQFSSYADVHGQLQHGIAEATKQISAVLNDIEEREKNKTKTKATAAAGRKEEDQKPDKVDAKPSAEATLPLDWCAPTSQNATPANEPGQSKGGAQ